MIIDVGQYHQMCDEVSQLRKKQAKAERERDEARAEAHEQARLLGMSGELELKLMVEIERLREERDYYRRDNEKLNNALAWEHNESENAKDAARYRWLQADIMRAIAVLRQSLRDRDMNAAIDAAINNQEKQND